MDGLYLAGQSITEKGGPDDVHIGRNLGPDPLVLKVLYIEPAGAPLSDDDPIPAAGLPDRRRGHPAGHGSEYLKQTDGRRRMSAENVRCLVTGRNRLHRWPLVPRLLERGLAVRALARNPDKLDDAPWRDRAEVVARRPR